MSNTDYTIPLNTITKIIGESLPDDSNGAITVEQDFIKALARAAHLFILYSTTKANEVASSWNRRTIHSQDVLTAITSLGFEHLIPKLIRWHATYIEEKEILKSRRKKGKEDHQDSSFQQLETSNIEDDFLQNQQSIQPPQSEQMEVEIITNECDGEMNHIEYDN